MLNRYDLTCLDLYEFTAYIGIQGQCKKCKKLFILEAPEFESWCPECNYGYLDPRNGFTRDCRRVFSGDCIVTRIKHNPVKWMDQLALEKRNMTEAEIEHMSLSVSRVLIKHPPGEYGLEKIFSEVAHKAFKAGMTGDNFINLQMRIIHRVYGNPTELMLNTSQQMYTIDYWNPTEHRINVSP